jgi:hypothetical protein
MRIEIKTVDPAAMRYPTAGDWEWLPDGALMLKVPEYGGRDISVLLVALHEMIEAYLCRRDGITDDVVTKFDTENPTLEEPGDHPDAPYHRQHAIAMAIEREAAIGTSTDWETHNKWVFDVGNEVERIDQQGGLQTSRILMEGARYWAELHLYSLRADKNGIPFGDMRYWLDDWIASLPFEGCPCEAHLKEWVALNSPMYGHFFLWGVMLHNAVNERIGKPIIGVAGARKLWESRTF